MLSEGADRIAVVGIGCRFPGSHGPERFWEMLASGTDGVGPTPAYRARVRSGVDPRLDQPELARRGALEEVENFDWRSFRISPREAKYMDPQQRLVLECSWEALEHAGFPHGSIAGRRGGVFVGIMWPDYAKLLAENPKLLAGYATPGTGFALAANRVSHYFDLRGPSVAVDVQCASSLIAVHLACQSLWSGDAEFALAGGANLILTPDADVMMSRAGILSSSGKCMTFDAHGDGFVRSEGVGMVVLKPEAAARLDGDRILALIRGTAVNHDGRREALTAPSQESQSELLRLACARAGIEPTALDYVELHGTGTERGDPTEARALGETVGAGRDPSQPCLVGSVKTNIGHCEAAAGVASLIKTVLAIDAAEIPPCIHHAEPHPQIPLRELRLRLVTEPTTWPRRSARPLAGVTGLSLGGANAHVVLEGVGGDRTRAPSRTRSGDAGTGSELLVLPISARTEEALRALAGAYLDLLGGPSWDMGRLRDLCWTAAVRRTHHEFRFAAVGGSTEELRTRLRTFLTDPSESSQESTPEAGKVREVVFVYAPMTAADESALDRLVADEPAARAVYQRLLGALQRVGEARSRALALQLAVGEAFRTAGIQPAAAFAVEGAAGMSLALHPNGSNGSSPWPSMEVQPLGRKCLGPEPRVIVQIGSGAPSGGPLLDRLDARGHECIRLPALERRESGRDALLLTLGELYTRRHPVIWARLYDKPRAVMTLPTYPWQKERLWIDPDED